MKSAESLYLHETSGHCNNEFFCPFMLQIHIKYEIYLMISNNDIALLLDVSLVFQNNIFQMTILKLI